MNEISEKINTKKALFMINHVDAKLKQVNERLGGVETDYVDSKVDLERRAEQLGLIEKLIWTENAKEMHSFINSSDGAKTCQWIKGIISNNRVNSDFSNLEMMFRQTTIKDVDLLKNALNEFKKRSGKGFLGVMKGILREKDRVAGIKKLTKNIETDKRKRQELERIKENLKKLQDQNYRILLEAEKEREEYEKAKQTIIKNLKEQREILFKIQKDDEALNNMISKRSIKTVNPQTLKNAKEQIEKEIGFLIAKKKEELGHRDSARKIYDSIVEKIDVIAKESRNNVLH